MTYTILSLALHGWDGHGKLLHSVGKKESDGGQPRRDNALQYVCSDEEEGNRFGKYDSGNRSCAAVVLARIVPYNACFICGSQQGNVEHVSEASPLQFIPQYHHQSGVECFG